MGRFAGTWAVLTDLDGTLLDHATYKWHAATGALEVLHRLRVPLILVTSKTRAEVIPILRGLRRREPFAVENGGAIYIPRGYFRFQVPGASPAGRGWLRIALGTPRQKLIQALDRAAKRADTSIRSFSEMSAREIAERTGLSSADTRRARQREFDEPFVVLSSGSKAVSRLNQEITRAGHHMTRGSRFFHILGKNDKGTAVLKLLACYRRASKTRIRSVGLGDSPMTFRFCAPLKSPSWWRGPTAGTIRKSCALSRAAAARGARAPPDGIARFCTYFAVPCHHTKADEKSRVSASPFPAISSIMPLLVADDPGVRATSEVSQ